MRKKVERERLEGLLAEIHESTNESGSQGQTCLSPMLGETVDDTDHNWTTEGDDYDELSK
jgi:hypothetical protein